MSLCVFLLDNELCYGMSFVLFWFDGRCACVSVERQSYAISWLRLYLWLRVYLRYVSACCIMCYFLLFGCTGACEIVARQLFPIS